MGRSLWHCLGNPRRLGPAFLCAIALVSQSAWALVGGESGAYLRAPTGATAFAMGGAGTATPDYLCAWWNPAILSTYKNPRAALGMGIRSMGRTEGFGSFAFRIPPRVGMGMSLLYRGDPFLTGLRDRDENEVERGAYTTLTLKIGLSYVVSRRLSVGGTIGIFYQNMPTSIAPDLSLHHSSVTKPGGFDLGLRYKLRDDWTVALVGRNLGVSMEWEVRSAASSLNVTIQDKPLPSFVAASRLERSLMDKPFVWTCDAVGYIFDGEWKRLPRAEAFLHNGFEWRRWETFRIRAGIGDLALSTKMFSDSKDYFDNFAFRLTAGFGVDLTKVREGLRLNYAVATDKVWAGIDQILDVTYAF